LQKYLKSAYRLLNEFPTELLLIGVLVFVIFFITIAYLLVKKPKKKRKKKKSKNQQFWRIYKVTTISLVFIALISALFYVGYKYTPRSFAFYENIYLSGGNHIFGIDVSHYQGKIKWEEVKTSKHPIKYVFIRSTMGKNGKDSHYRRNWRESKKHNYLRGAYHYYRPFENSAEQFQNFSKTVKLESGDFRPVLDIEAHSKYGADNLRKGILNWLRLAEEHYGHKPIIYTGRSFYQDVLRGHVDDYPLWIASYSGKHKLHTIDWDFHQFTEKVRVNGIKTSVDGNDFRGDSLELQNLLIP
jgi:lysozyme